MKYVLLLLLAALGTIQTSYACSCIAPPGPLEAMEDADFVFTGKVESIIPVNDEYSNSLFVKFSIRTQWKGDLSEEVFVKTADNSAACGYNFKRNQSYLVYGYVNEGVMGTSICTRTTSLEQADEDLRILGSGEQVNRSGLCGGPTSAVVVQTFLFLMVAMMFSRRRPRWTTGQNHMLSKKS